MNNIFVYGTLRKDRIKTVVPEIAPYIKIVGRGHVKGKLFDTGEYPAAVKNSNGKVYGEIIQIEPSKLIEVLEMLDEYEDFIKNNPSESLFLRDVVNVDNIKGNTTKAWIYWYNKDTKNLAEIKDGIYRKRKPVSVNG